MLKAGWFKRTTAKSDLDVVWHRADQGYRSFCGVNLIGTAEHRMHFRPSLGASEKACAVCKRLTIGMKVGQNACKDKELVH
jgi:hypothetical protein